MAAPKINYPKTGNVLGQQAPENPFACQPRKSPAAGPKDISSMLFHYLPMDKEYTTIWRGRNMFGSVIHKQKLEAGRVYESYDGKRLVFEVGCNTIIYLHINQNTSSHHKFFIQASEDFFASITDILVASKVTKATAPIVTFAKYEMYFLMSMFSTVSFPMWIAVTGSDVTYLLALNKVKIDAFRKLSNTLNAEKSNIATYAPTLHSKLDEFISNEKINNAKTAAKDLPNKVVTNEKAQAQVAGILYGKYVLSSSAFTVWTALSTVLIQALIKSATNSVDAYSSAIDQRYSGTLKDLRNVDWNNDAEVRMVSQNIEKIFKEAEVTLTAKEATDIFNEVKTHKNELDKSIKNIHKAFVDFNTKVK